MIDLYYEIDWSEEIKKNSSESEDSYMKNNIATDRGDTII